MTKQEDTFRSTNYPPIMAETSSVTESEKSASSVGLVDRENLNRLLKIFNGGTGVDLGRRVTINEKQPAKPTPHMTQRVKTFYIEDHSALNATKRDTILLPNMGTRSARTRSMIGGTPITRETAIELRNITIGSTVHSLSPEWRRSGFQFQDISSKYPYGLQASRCGAHAFILCVQGYLLKHLLFAREYSSSLGVVNAITPTEFERRRALCSAICDILWQAGNQMRCCVTLLQEEAIFDTDYRYRVDGVTEKLHLYEFKKYQDLEIFMKRHLSHFENTNSNGCILMLYSVILSRTISKVYEDMGVDMKVGGVKLLTDNEVCMPALVNLMLTGRATKHYHNGSIIYDSDGKALPHPLRGIRERSQVGFLFWDKGENPDERTEVGSMLKTPKHPIWLTLVNGQFGLLFSVKIDLVSDWRVEHHFVLNYYTGLSQNTGTPLSIDTRYTRRMRCKTGIARKVEEDKTPALEQCILTKWYGANIDWHQVYPFI